MGWGKRCLQAWRVVGLKARVFAGLGVLLRAAFLSLLLLLNVAVSCATLLFLSSP